MQTISPKQINTLRAQFGSVKTCTVEQYKKLKETVGKLGPAGLMQLADAQIPFLSTAANSVLCDRGIRPESARWEHAIDVITDMLVQEHYARQPAQTA